MFQASLFKQKKRDDSLLSVRALAGGQVPGPVSELCSIPACLFTKKSLKMGILSELDKVAGDILKDTRDILIFFGRLLLISTFIEDGFRMWHQWTGNFEEKRLEIIFW